MENPFSFLKDEALSPSPRSTRRQSLRQMRYSAAYQPNVLQCQSQFSQKHYVGKLGASWTFPSDHLPVGARLLELINIASWNVLNKAYLFWIARDLQGLAESATLKRKDREHLLLQTTLDILLHKTHPKHLLALQECSSSFLRSLKDSLPPSIDLLYKDEACEQNFLAILYDKNLFTLRSVNFTYPFSGCPNDEVMDVHLEHGSLSFRFVHTHVPGDPKKPSRFELIDHLCGQSLENTILLGDLNFTEWEMASALSQKTNDFTLCKIPYATNIGPDLYAKQIDHIGSHKALPLAPLDPEEVLPSLETHCTCLSRSFFQRK